MQSEYFVLLPNDICCSLQSFAAIALKSKKFDGKFVTAKCSCINYGATLRSLFLKTPLSPPLVVYGTVVYGTVEYDGNDGDARALSFPNLPYESEPENCVIKKIVFLFRIYCNIHL